jgi:hypothetical protein
MPERSMPDQSRTEALRTRTNEHDHGVRPCEHAGLATPGVYRVPRIGGVLRIARDGG